ncbi:MAG: GNAT family N-acetyltransferase [Erysipelotrichaceae bacterium]|nr:GNAT family N-acetyltransferase [Erysipelotrichaceae bacterium]
MKISEAELNEEILKELIDLSVEWEKEDSCYGYRSNQEEDIRGNRIFLAQEDGRIVAYLFGHSEESKNQTSIIPNGTKCFEIMEIYVRKEYRNQGIGKELFSYAEDHIDDAYITLSTATKNWKAILHFYIDETDMTFHSARLFKRIKKDGVSN